MTDISPPDYTTAVGKVRALIPDVEQVDWENDGISSYLFTDLHLKGLLDINTYVAGVYQRWDVKRAAADALGALAVSEALIAKVVKTEDLQTDGAKLANALFARVQQLRQQADSDEEDNDSLTAFSIVEFHPQRPVPIQDWTLPIAAWRDLLTP
jgi:hypothetical protein